MLDKTKCMILPPDPEGNITIPGADYTSKQTKEMFIGYGPLIPAPPGFGCKWTRNVFAVAILHDITINEWVVIANGDDGSWDSIDPLNVGIKPKDMGNNYRFWIVDVEYDNIQSKKVKRTMYMEYNKESVPDWGQTQYLTIEDSELGSVQAEVIKAKPALKTDLYGHNLAEAFDAELEEE